MSTDGYQAKILISLSATVLISLISVPCLADVASWTEPAIDRWFHQGQTTPGLKTDLSTFADFAPGAGFSPARAGTILLGFDTSDQIPRVDPSRYQINSVTLNATMVDDGRQIPYDPTPDLLADIAGGTDDIGKPIELYGVGFENGYTQLGFGPSDAQPPEFEESSPLWNTSLPLLQRTFNVFPLGDDGTGAGTLGNIFNSPGGEGIFELDANNDPVLVQVIKQPWNPIPWAVGTVAGLNPGDLVPGNSLFSFDVDLTLPSVADTFQQSLALGQVGIFLSSLHDLSGFHTGGQAEDFPAFYSKESLGVQFGLVSAATLDINYAISPLPGDFDGDGDVDEGDLDLWNTAFGGGNGADADGDGDSDGADFLLWQRNFTGSQPVGLAVVPEPATVLLLLIGFANTIGRRSRGRSTAERP